MEQELDYAEMLEIPVSTVNVVKKKGLNLFKRKPAKRAAAEVFEQPAEQTETDELKNLVVDSVNERVGAYVYAEDVSDPREELPAAVAVKPKKRDRGNMVVLGELIAVCVIAAAIFLTNVFMPTSVINTFISSLANGNKKPAEPAYSDIKLSSVVSDFSDADITVSDNGVLSFTAEGAVYPVCAGTVASVAKDGETYVVKIAHTSTFSSVITGLSQVYSQKDTAVAANIPFGYSDGKTQVQVSMYDGETLLNCYTLSGEIPVWNS